MRLHVFPPSPNAIVVLAAAELLDVPYAMVVVDLFRGDQRSPDFTALNPNRKMPVLEDDGFVLWESNAIAQYVASRRPDRGFWPSDPRRRADVARWQFWQTAHFGPACGTFVFERVVKQHMALGAPNEPEIARTAPELERLVDVLNGCLRVRAFVAGDAPTVADVSLGAWMVYADEAGYPLASSPEVRRWYGDLAALPGWQRTLAIVDPWRKR